MVVLWGIHSHKLFRAEYLWFLNLLLTIHLITSCLLCYVVLNVFYLFVICSVVEL